MFERMLKIYRFEILGKMWKAVMDLIFSLGVEWGDLFCTPLFIMLNRDYPFSRRLSKIFKQLELDRKIKRKLKMLYNIDRHQISTWEETDVEWQRAFFSFLSHIIAFPELTAANWILLSLSMSGLQKAISTDTDTLERRWGRQNRVTKLRYSIYGFKSANRGIRSADWTLLTEILDIWISKLYTRYLIYRFNSDIRGIRYTDLKAISKVFDIQIIGR